MPWPFDRDFMRLALIAGVAVGLSAPMIGAFLVQKRLSLLGDGIGHLAFAGVAAGVLFGIWPVWTALAAATGAQGNSTALVGTPETVAKAMREYYKLGATSLLIRGYDPRPDAVQYGEELIPRLRKLVADYDAAKMSRRL